MLASRAGVTGHDFSTLAGAELPTVTEQQVSPVSSIHVELQEYHSSSGEGLVNLFHINWIMFKV